jgi:hypothetical protein
MAAFAMCARKTLTNKLVKLMHSRREMGLGLEFAADGRCKPLSNLYLRGFEFQKVQGR